MLAILLATATPVMAASNDCTVAPGIGLNSNYSEVIGVDEGNWWDFGWGSSSDDDLLSLRSDLYVEVELRENHAQALRMELVPGYSYTFCIEFHTDPNNPPTDEPSGDVYLLSGSNWDAYQRNYEEVNNGWGMTAEDIEWIPVEWRDMAIFIPFRDSHAYEGKRSTTFSTALDSDNRGFVSWFDDGGDAEYFLVVDNWNNTRQNDALSVDGDMIVQIWVDVEDRLTLPKFTAYLIVGLLPMSCVIVPIILHTRYHAAGLEETSEQPEMVPLLEQ
jgi:hypothetical protein